MAMCIIGSSSSIALMFTSHLWNLCDLTNTICFIVCHFFHESKNPFWVLVDDLYNTKFQHVFTCQMLVSHVYNVFTNYLHRYDLDNDMKRCFGHILQEWGFISILKSIFLNMIVCGQSTLSKKHCRKVVNATSHEFPISSKWTWQCYSLDHYRVKYHSILLNKHGYKAFNSSFQRILVMP